MVKRRVFLGMGDLPPLIGNPYNGYINPYYWVDDHPLLYGDNGSLDPGTYDSSEFGAVIIKLSHCSLHDPSCQPSQRHTPEGHKAQTYQCGWPGPVKTKSFQFSSSVIYLISPSVFPRPGDTKMWNEVISLSDGCFFLWVCLVKTSTFQRYFTENPEIKMTRAPTRSSPNTKHIVSLRSWILTDTKFIQLNKPSGSRRTLKLCLWAKLWFLTSGHQLTGASVYCLEWFL